MKHHAQANFWGILYQIDGIRRWVYGIKSTALRANTSTSQLSSSLAHYFRFSIVFTQTRLLHQSQLSPKSPKKMKSTAPILALAVAAAAAPIDKRQSGFDLGSLTGGMGSSAGSFGDLGSLSSLGSTGSSLGSLGSLPGSTTTGSSTDSPLGSLGSFPSSGSSLGSFGSLPSTGSSLGSLGSLPSTGSSLGSIGSLPSTGSAGSLGSLGSLEGASTGSSLGSLGSFPASSADSPSPTNSSSAGLESSEPESTTATPSAGLSAPSGNCKAVTLLFARGTGEPGMLNVRHHSFYMMLTYTRHDGLHCWAATCQGSRCLLGR